jgi:hypothetical protein
MLKLKLSVVDDLQIRLYEELETMPEMFHIEEFWFYHIDYIGPYSSFKNLCVVGSGGAQFVVAATLDELIDAIDDQTQSKYLFFKN